MSEQFQYTDENDRLTRDMISHNYDAAYWKKSEDRVLKRAEEYLEEKYGRRLARMSLLDLGCGKGRLLPRFAALVGQVTALEPDSGRFSYAQALARKTGTQNAEVFCGDLRKYLAEHPNVNFDIVLCSHVIQHVSHEKMRDILKMLSCCIPKGGCLILTTMYTYGENNQYGWEFWKDGTRNQEEIDEAGFENILALPGTLATCRFARPWLSARLLDCGFKTERFYPFHFAGTHDPELDDAYADSPEHLPLARDAMYICERNG